MYLKQAAMLAIKPCLRKLKLTSCNRKKNTAANNNAEELVAIAQQWCVDFKTQN